MPLKSSFTRWYFQIGFLFPPRNLGKLDKFDEDIFRIGWFNHQQTCQSFLQIFPICKDSGTCFPIKNRSKLPNSMPKSDEFLLVNLSPPTPKPQTPCLGKKPCLARERRTYGPLRSPRLHEELSNKLASAEIEAETSDFWLLRSP